jgi:aromatic-L-amino-acid decarboxylase
MDMRALDISEQELSRLADTAVDLAKNYWASLEDRAAYPSTSARETTRLFARPWQEEGRGADVLQDFHEIAEHVRPSTGRFLAMWRDRASR